MYVYIYMYLYISAIRILNNRPHGKLCSNTMGPSDQVKATICCFVK